MTESKKWTLGVGSYSLAIFARQAKPKIPSPNRHRCGWPEEPNVDKKSAARSRFVLRAFHARTRPGKWQCLRHGCRQDRRRPHRREREESLRRQPASTRDAKTDDSGHYLVPLLPVSVYTIHVEAQGFQTTEQKDIRLQVDEQREDQLHPESRLRQSIRRGQRRLGRRRNHQSDARPGHHVRRGRQPSSERPQLRSVGHTDSRNHSGNQPNSFFNSAASSEVATRGTFSLSVGGSRAQSTDWLIDNNDNDRTRPRGGIAILPTSRLHSGIQGPHLQLLGRIWNPRGSDRSDHHQVRHQQLARQLCTSTSAIRSSTREAISHKPSIVRATWSPSRKVQSQSVRRLARRTDSEE